MYMVTTSFMKILNFFEIFEILKFFENFQILNFTNFFETLKFYEILWKLKFSLLDDEVQVFRINIKLLSNPVAELKIRENDSHCRSIHSLKNYGPLNSQRTGKGEK